MKMRKTILLAVLAMISMACPALQAQQLVPVDPDVRTGVLKNGLTYYVKQNHYPQERADFFIAQRVGSIQEQEDQRGLAHFLEHMCFNGTKHFPGNSLITYMESIGVKFGANLNAYTSTDETVYNISNVPTARRSVLDTCFLVLADWSHDLLLKNKDIDEERGVIEGEYRYRSGANYRLLEKSADDLYPGCLYGQRMPIGLMSVVKNFKYKTLKDYYKKWYHPSNQAIIVVGDIDPDYAVAKIEQLFGGIKNPKNSAPIVPVPVPDNEEIIATVQTDKEQTTNSVRILFKHDDLPDKLMPTTEFLRQSYLKSVITSMLNTRFADLAQEPDAPFVRVVSADRDYMISKTRQAFQLMGVAKDGKSQLTMQHMAREVSRAVQHGFTDGEYRRARLQYEASLAKLLRESDKYSNTRYARDFVRAFIDGEPIPSIEDNDRIMKQLIAGISLTDVNSFFRSLISETDRNVALVAFVTEKESAQLSKPQLIDAFHQGRAEQVTPYVDTLNTSRLLLTEPVAGSIVSEEYLPEFDAKRLTLSNGMKVTLKKTLLNANEVIIAGAGPGGLSQNYTAADAPSLKVINAVMGVTGYGAFTASELKKALAGKNVTARTFVSKTEEGFQATSTPADLETAFQLLYLKLTAPLKDEKAFNSYIEASRTRLDNQQVDPKFEFADSLFAYVFNRHPMAAEKLQKDEIDHVNYDRILAVYRDRFSDMTDVNVYVVGNFNEDTVRTLLEKYVASLPAAGRVETPRDMGYRLFTGQPRNEWSRKMENPQDKVYFFWTCEMNYDLRTSLIAKITGQIFNNIFREEIREKRGWTYHVDTHCSVVPDHNGTDRPVVYFPLNVTLKQGTARECRDLINSVMTGVAQNGLTEDRLATVKQYLKKVYAEDVADNSYWMVMLKNRDKFGINFDRDYLATIDAITTADIQHFVQQLLAGSRLELQMTPVMP